MNQIPTNENGEAMVLFDSHKINWKNGWQNVPTYNKKGYIIRTDFYHDNNIHSGYVRYKLNAYGYPLKSICYDSNDRIRYIEKTEYTNFHKLSLMYHCNPSGTVIWKRVYHYNSKQQRIRKSLYFDGHLLIEKYCFFRHSGLLSTVKIYISPHYEEIIKTKEQQFEVDLGRIMLHGPIRDRFIK